MNRSKTFYYFDLDYFGQFPNLSFSKIGIFKYPKIVPTRIVYLVGTYVRDMKYEKYARKYEICEF